MNSSSDHSYCGPEVEYSRESAMRLRQRFDSAVRTRAEELFQAARADWARSNFRSYPVREDCIAAGQAEFEQVCQALGRWAAVEPNSFFRPEDRGLGLSW